MILNCGTEEVLITCVADGAGSASHSDRGAELACDRFVELVGDFNSISSSVWDFTQTEAETQIHAWLTRIHNDLKDKSAEFEVEIRQLACTFLGAIILPNRAFFVQIGDGAIVRGTEDGYRTVFWPQSGEYANTTNFLTGPQFDQHLMIHIVEDTINEIALFTDGLERLILKFDDRSVHEPFLTPLFEPLRHCETADVFFEPLRNFLCSPAVNARTDDDKTLVLATRRK